MNLRKGTLVYIGINRGVGLRHICDFYQRVVAIEANPNLISFLKSKYSDRPHVEIYNFAAGLDDGDADFSIASNDGKSSSLMPIDSTNEHVRELGLSSSEPIRVPSRNLGKFLEEIGVEHIDLYVSDIEEFDFSALQTLGPYIDEKRIETIQVEVRGDACIPTRINAPDNRLSSVVAYLKGRYTLVGTGNSYLKKGEFINSENEDGYFDALFSVDRD